MWERTLSAKNAGFGVFLITLIIFNGCGSAPESNEWRTSGITQNGTVADRPPGSVLVGAPEQIGEDVRIHMVDTLCAEQECRIVAVSTDGQTHLGNTIVRLDPVWKCRSTVAVFGDIALHEIQEFQFQARPLREGVSGIAGESRLSNAVRKRRLVDEVCENRLFESHSVH